MKNPTKIAHPLKTRRGTSQRTRLVEALQPETAPIDGKTLADRLYLICEYARHIKFHETANHMQEGEYQRVGTWYSFFTDSLPFQLAKLSKLSVSNLELQFLLLHKELTANPSKQSLESLVEFIYNKLILPNHQLYQTVVLAESSFKVPLLTTLESSFKEPLKCFIALYNASVTYLCLRKKDFTQFMDAPWLLGIDDIYTKDSCIQKVKKGKKEAYLLAADTLKTLFGQIFNGFQEIIINAPKFIKESLRPHEESLKQKHEAHLALLFTFLELFNHFQGDINSLGKKHLDFFYREVLKMIPGEAVPDKAHLVFEVAKHLDAHLLQKGLLLKDGKDDNKQDIQFGLEHELVIDKAQIKDLRTLFLNPITDGTNSYTEGVYMTPMANSADGKGKKFKKDEPNNWPTLGYKYSKCLQEGELVPEDHPKARLGFVLSSPVLLLQEGQRSITILLDCEISNSDNEFTPAELTKFLDDIESKLQIDATKTIFCITDQLLEECDLSLAAKTYLSKLLVQQNPYEIQEKDLDTFLDTKDPISCLPIFSEDDGEELRTCLEDFELTKKTVENSLFKLWFSGEEEWIPAIPTVIIHKPPTEGLNPTGQIQFELSVILNPEDPAVVFYDEDILKENLDLKDDFPLVKIELNRDLKINCETDPNDDDDPNCCLKKRFDDQDLWISPYHFLKKLRLVNAEISVDVCGVKNLIVENDDNLQDVNKPIMPFGPRPKVGDGGFIDGGANFYVGSKEIFCKNWTKFWLNMEWKDKPKDLQAYYEFYDNVASFEDGTNVITNDSFKYRVSILQDGTWKSDTINNPPHDPPDYKTSRLFHTNNIVGNPCSNSKNDAAFCHGIEGPFTQGLRYTPKSMLLPPLEPLTVNTRKGFARLTLAGVSFQHDRYTFVLARQMMALAGLLDPVSVAKVQTDLLLSEKLSDEAKSKIASINIQLGFLIADLAQGLGHTNNILGIAQGLQTDLQFVQTNFDADPINAKITLGNAIGKIGDILDLIGTALTAGTLKQELEHLEMHTNNIKGLMDDGGGLTPIPDDDIQNNIAAFGLTRIIHELSRRIKSIKDTLKIDEELGIPKEPYTPLIKSLSVDYKAVALKDDMEIVHLYPFEKTSKSEDIQQNPTLFPYFGDEGTLFIGLEELTPGGGLSILFQLAEATADSEQNRAEIDWYYLSNNEWIALRQDFEVIADGTDGLTVSGIVSIAVPDAISKIGNTVMPDEFYWIKVAAPKNVLGVAETIGIHTQAGKVSAKINALNDPSRLETELKAGSIAKLVEGDFSVKKVLQPYTSFGGRKPEVAGHFYTRVSEHLKHKGRAHLLHDYEKIVLEGFPEIYKAKCISHSMGLSAIEYRRDLEIAPGFVIVSVIPDLTKLKAGNTLKPKAPVSLLEKIGDHLRNKTSPFARLKVMNPRYEYVNVCVAVRLYRGKPQTFYANKLKEDITLFLAPWFVGDMEKLAFGQEVFFSDVVGFIEGLDYVDYIVALKLDGECEQNGQIIKPLTARSILTAGEICVDIDLEDCPQPILIDDLQN